MILQDNPNRRPQTLGGMAYLLLLVTTVTGLLLAAVGAWRAGIVAMGGGLLVGALARLLLPEDRAGMLRVRRKPVDVAMMVLVGVALLTLAAVIRNQPV